MSVKLFKIYVKKKILCLPKDTFHILHNTYGKMIIICFNLDLHKYLIIL